MIAIIQEEFENTIGHTLKVDDIYLASNAKSGSKYWLNSGFWFLSSLDNNTMGTNVCEQLANVPGDVAICGAYTEIKRSPLAVIDLVELPEVDKKPLSISWLLKT